MADLKIGHYSSVPSHAKNYETQAGATRTNESRKSAGAFGVEAEDVAGGVAEGGDPGGAVRRD